MEFQKTSFQGGEQTSQASFILSESPPFLLTLTHLPHLHALVKGLTNPKSTYVLIDRKVIHLDFVLIFLTFSQSPSCLTEVWELHRVEDEMGEGGGNDIM